MSAFVDDVDVQRWFLWQKIICYKSGDQILVIEKKRMMPIFNWSLVVNRLILIFTTIIRRTVELRKF